MTFGAVIKDKVMLYKSLRNELIGILVCCLTGAVMGILVAPFMNRDDQMAVAFGVNTQISSRGEWIALAWGAGIAAPSGVGVALGVSSDQVSALIGVAISAALLPPITNSGLCLASALVFHLDPDYPDTIVMKWFRIGYKSFLLFVLNWVLIFIFGYLTFRAKKLHQSANEQAKMLRLNKFYEMRDRSEKDNQSNLNLGHTMNLKTPLLTNNSNTIINYSDNEINPNISTDLLLSNNMSAIKMKSLQPPKTKTTPTTISKQARKDSNETRATSKSAIADSLNDDSVPSMLASLSEINVDMNQNSNTDINNHNKNDEMTTDFINWDPNKIQGRTSRGMSDVTSMKIEIDDNALSKKRNIKRTSLDETTTKLNGLPASLYSKDTIV